jgi:hypothetical protein
MFVERWDAPWKVVENGQSVNREISQHRRSTLNGPSASEAQLWLYLTS